MRTLRPLSLLIALSACRAEAPPPARVEPLSYAVAGCSSTSEDAACHTTDTATLSVWIPVSAHERVELSAGATLVSREARDTGALLRLRPRPPGELRVQVVSATVTRSLSLRVETSTGTSAAAAEAMAAGRRALRAGDTTLALRRLAEAERGPSFLARRAAMLGAYVAAVMVGDQADADAHLARLPPPTALDGEGAALVAFHRGLVHAMVGDRRAALRALEPAAKLAERLDLAVLADIRQLEALQLVEIGRATEAVAALADLARAQDTRAPRARADLLNNLAAARLVATSSDAPGAAESRARARAELTRALSDYTTLEAVTDANNARVTLAMLELDDARLPASRAALAAVQGPELPLTAAWRRLLEVRLALAEGERERACRAAERLAADAVRALWPTIEARAELALGTCHEAAGRREAAMAAYQRAAAALRSDEASVPMERGTLERVDVREALVGRTVRLALAMGRRAEAFDVARRALRADHARVARARRGAPAERSRWLSALADYRAAREALDRAALDAWQATSTDAPRQEATLRRLRADVRAKLDALLGAPAAEDEAPPPLPEGELRLLELRVGRRALIMGARASEVYAEWAPEAGAVSAEWGPEALALRRAVQQARTVRVLGEATATLRSLLGARAWAHTADLAPAPRDRGPRRALVLADPRLDLPEARREGAEVAQRLRERGWSVELRTGADVRRADVERGLGEVSLLHYAGHGRDQAEGRWDGALLLADGELEVADIVAAEGVPRWVVLSGCQTAMIGRGDLSLAQAFVLAGAEAVVATSSVVEDRRAREFSSALYAASAEAWSPETAFEPDETFRLLVR